ncbi:MULTISPECIES: ATP-binding cassette domain-containing protein [Shewanella]|jgi:sodium transport system ATP-binding protein|uniref:ATP-binding cassette domain-containing protein n=1 Tax=Shewanella chilikensis TaxID=558541 RepID=A0A6G7LXY4_9GAMM|nr:MULTISPECIES: ATP-binding cassette domain-containing protein [Shewanella]OIN14681.1 ABC transporter [Shewanella algae]MCE9792285.1 ATP-binding cassette domain-containing protein [Shewanella indica]MCL1161141.1 ATP-binding cassette domain-containing protein [Shewanella chilikensis]QIJ06505.1 ATP-binding cassette domain-containing protein [Shewanella chilikensis]QWL02780.1 ATP-binding cassette domain-containing protein [Shewanella indica]
MIKVTNLSKRIGKVQALDGLSFSAEDGMITGLLGPNGAGKTTCLRTVFGLLKPDEGIAEVDGIDVGRNPLAAKQQLGLFPDPFGLYERLSPREYIRFFAELSGMPSKAAKQATADVLGKLKMDDIADRHCKGFSQGQRMKTALAQAIVHQPTNIILDEPTRGLDVMSTRVLRELLLDLKRQGHCVLFSSHVMQEVAALCDKVIVMTQGRVVAVGSPTDLCRQTGKESLEDAFIQLIGTDEGIAA